MTKLPRYDNWKTRHPGHWELEPGYWFCEECQAEIDENEVRENKLGYTHKNGPCCDPDEDSNDEYGEAEVTFINPTEL